MTRQKLPSYDDVRRLEQKIDDLAEATGPHRAVTSTPPAIAWFQRQVGKAVIAAAITGVLGVAGGYLWRDCQGELKSATVKP